MGKRPSGKYTLDRINNDKGYSSDNCRWATRQEQMNNTTKTNYLLTKHGERVSLMDMSRKTGIHPETLRYRIKKGWHAEGLDTPPLKPKSRTRRSNGKFI
jgi:sugar diacid utilization regulator